MGEVGVITPFPVLQLACVELARATADGRKAG